MRLPPLTSRGLRPADACRLSRLAACAPGAPRPAEFSFTNTRLRYHIQVSSVRSRARRHHDLVQVSSARSRSRCQVPVSRRVSMARHAPALRPDPGTAFLEPKPQVALITIAVCASSYETIHYCYKQHRECNASDLLCTLRAATKRLNGISMILEESDSNQTRNPFELEKKRFKDNLKSYSHFLSQFMIICYDLSPIKQYIFVFICYHFALIVSNPK